MKSELLHLQHEESSMNEKIKDNKEKIKLNKQLPYLVSNVVEVAMAGSRFLSFPKTAMKKVPPWIWTLRGQSAL
jgi:ATP-dependent 26S proteasome regulatory subunit